MKDQTPIMKPLTTGEAARAKTELESQGIFLKHRELAQFSPITIGRRYKLDPWKVAAAAGRVEQKEEA